MQARPMPSCGVCPSVTFVHSVETNKYVFNFFTVRKPQHSSFSILNVMAIFRREFPNGNVECRWGRQKSRFSVFLANTWLHCVVSTLRSTRCYQHGAARPWQIVTLITGSSKRRSLLMAGDDDEMYMMDKKSQRYTKDNRTAHLTALTHSLTAALDQLRVVASSTSNDPGPRSRQHQQIGQCLLPIDAANFSVDDPAGAFSQQREECRCGLLLTVEVPAKQVCSPVGDRCVQIMNDVCQQ